MGSGTDDAGESYYPGLPGEMERWRKDMIASSKEEIRYIDDEMARLTARRAVLEKFLRFNDEPQPSRCEVCVDFDGVLHRYDSGWQGACVIPDPPVPGAMAWLAEMAHDPRFQLCVYSSRSREPGAVEAMRHWLGTHLVAFYTELGGLTEEEIPGAAQFVLDALRFPTQKPAAQMSIDDRAFCFNGEFPTAEWILGFKPWNKRKETK